MAVLDDHQPPDHAVAELLFEGNGHPGARLARAQDQHPVDLRPGQRRVAHVERFGVGVHDGPHRRRRVHGGNARAPNLKQLLAELRIQRPGPRSVRGAVECTHPRAVGRLSGGRAY